MPELTEDRRMQCMEVWGGNSPVQTHLALAGLDAWVYCKPFGGAAGGGDVYYFSSCATGRISRILLADVSGHGHHAAETAGVLRRLMQQYVNYLDQRQFIRRINESFAKVATAGLFATAVVASFFSPSNHLSLCIAGHPLPFVWRAKTRRWQLLEDQRHVDSGDLPLGIDTGVEYTLCELDLDDGDLVLIYSDALIDASDAVGTALGVDGLLRITEEMAHSAPEKVIDDVIARVQEQSHGNLDGDDTTVMLLRPTGELRKLSWSRRLLAPWHFLKASWRALRKGEPIAWPEVSRETAQGLVAPTPKSSGR